MLILKTCAFGAWIRARGKGPNRCRSRSHRFIKRLFGTVRLYWVDSAHHLHYNKSSPVEITSKLIGGLGFREWDWMRLVSTAFSQWNLYLQLKRNLRYRRPCSGYFLLFWNWYWYKKGNRDVDVCVSSWQNIEMNNCFNKFVQVFFFDCFSPAATLFSYNHPQTKETARQTFLQV